MAIVGIYKIALTNAKLGLTKEVMANKVRFSFVYSIIIGFCIGCSANFFILSTIWKELLYRVFFQVLKIGYFFNACPDPDSNFDPSFLRAE
jgi:hypothetical protein